jgi:hypothetical protein
VLASLFEPIKAELKLSDAELGVLGGIAVSLFGACFGVHIARAADRRARRAGVLAACLTAWSVATAASGAARGFGGLLAARVCVGVGEAGAIPISLALLADAYPQAQRSSAMSVYYTGIPAGILLGLFLGGWLAQSCGWRGAFCAVGVPGLALAALLALRLREPPRGHADKVAAEHGGSADGDDEDDGAALLREGHPGAGGGSNAADVQRRRAALPPPLQLQLLALARCRTFVHVLLGGALNLFTAIGTFAFMPSLLGRRFGTPPGVAGSALSAVMLFAAASTLAGGAACDAAFRRRGALSVYALLPAAVVACAFPFGVAMCAARSLPAALLLFLPPTAAANVGSGPLRCLVSALVPPNSRGAANSVLEVGIGLAGGLGPLVVGAASDALQRRGRSPGDALAMAMLSIQFAALPAALCLWRAAANSERDARRAKAGGGAGGGVSPTDEDDAA